MALAELDADGIPYSIAHIAPDLFDPGYDRGAVIVVGSRPGTAPSSGVARPKAVSGIGNIYADEALWRAGSTAAGRRTP